MEVATVFKYSETDMGCFSVFFKFIALPNLLSGYLMIFQAINKIKQNVYLEESIDLVFYANDQSVDWLPRRKEKTLIENEVLYFLVE